MPSTMLATYIFIAALITFQPYTAHSQNQVLLTPNTNKYQSTLLRSSKVSPPHNGNESKKSKIEIPEKVIIGYGGCDSPIIESVQSGVNVVIWLPFAKMRSSSSFTNNDGHNDNMNDVNTASTHTDTDDDDDDDTFPILVGGPDHQCVQEYKKQLNDLGYNHVVHLISFGGWNTPHFDFGASTFTSEQLYKVWKQFNKDEIFHGFDWDFEGNDIVSSSINHYTLECLDQMGQMSQMAKQDGYIITMAPPESYLDFSTSDFSRYVNLTYPKDLWHEDFQYHGRNLYSYLLAKYGSAIDLISVQLYESYSHASYHITNLSTPPSEYLVSLVEQLFSHSLIGDSENRRDNAINDVTSKDENRGPGYWVNFSQDPNLQMKDMFVPIPLSKLVIGLANGWAKKRKNHDKTLYISPLDAGIAYSNMHFSNDQNYDKMEDKIRGFMFWYIGAEVSGLFDFISGLNDALQIRDQYVDNLEES